MDPEVAARAAIDYVRAWYDESIFPPRPKGPHTEVYDGEAAAVGRMVCDYILREFERFLHDDDDEVEVTTNEMFETAIAQSEPVAVVVPATQMRRSGAKNVSSPHLQNAFINEARSVMGQSTEEDVVALVGWRVKLIFNTDKAPVTGVLTEVSHTGWTYLILDDDKSLLYPLNSIQTIEKA